MKMLHRFSIFCIGNALLELSKKENKVNVKIVQENIRGCFVIIKY